MIILSTGTLYNYGIARVFAMAAEIGFDGVEVMVDDRWDTRQPAYLRSLAGKHGLPIVAVHSPFVAHVQGWPHDQWARVQQTALLARKVGARVVIAHLPFRIYGVLGHVHGWNQPHFRLPLPVPWPRREMCYYALRDGGLEKLELDSGVIIAVENMPAMRMLGCRTSGVWFNRPEELQRFPHLTLDTTHLATWGLEPLAIYDQLKERVAHVHLSNFDGKEHRSPPDGEMRLDLLLRRMAADGYRGAISVEGSPDALDAEDERRCRAALRRALAYCREHFTR